MTATLAAALVAAVGFSGTGLLALLGRGIGARGRSYAVATAAAILLALAFADLFPEALEMARGAAVSGFVGGFVALSLVESLLKAHTHHAPKEQAVLEHVREHALAPFLLGLAAHNLADGFVLGVGAGEAGSATGAAGLVGLGVLVHQIPVGVSLAAVLVAAGTSRGASVAAAVLLGLAIPFAAGLTAGLPVGGDAASGLLTGAAAGVLVYVGTSHLLPEAGAEGSSRATGLVFAATLVLTTAALLTVLGD